jgi:8-oxo-dGTP diphosphatase
MDAGSGAGPEAIDASGWPTKLVAAGVLLRDRAGAVLLVEPTYKDTWEIPGGMVEAGESPTEAAHRECREELGRDIDVGPLLCVHYASSTQVPLDGIAFIFDGGTTTLVPGDLTLPADELASAAFVDPADLARYLLPPMVRRVRAAIEAARTGTFAYLERT